MFRRQYGLTALVAAGVILFLVAATSGGSITFVALLAAMGLVVVSLSDGESGKGADASDVLLPGVLYRVLWRRQFPTPRQWGGQYVVQAVGQFECRLIQTDFELYEFFEVDRERGRITAVRDRTNAALRERHIDERA